MPASSHVRRRSGLEPRVRRAQRAERTVRIHLLCPWEVPSDRAAWIKWLVVALFLMPIGVGYGILLGYHWNVIKRRPYSVDLYNDYDDDLARGKLSHGRGLHDLPARVPTLRAWDV